MFLNANIVKEVNHAFRYLHSHPEISWEEVGTTEYIRNRLIENGCRVKTLNGITGVVGEIGSGKPVVAIRADMDALWQEVNGCFQANHSCGHDAHMAMVLGAVSALSAHKEKLKGTVRFIFQPAEEKGTGALALVDQGIVDDVDYLFGVHLRPIQELANGKASPSILHGAGAFVEGEIIGEDAHSARPHLGVNAIEVGAAIVQALQSIHADPMIPHSIKMTSFHAGGTSSNIIPGCARFGLDVRAQTNELMESLLVTLKHRIRAVESLYHVKVILNDKAKIAAAQNHEDAQRLMEEAIIEVIGRENLKPSIITSGGDDFHYYTIKRPHIKATMLGLGCDLAPGLHHPNMTFDHQALEAGTGILINVIFKALHSSSNS
ncbi:M20 peptidase aminoacylase family protein [Fictibacillus fluitans]|uniref:M20 peptidase aminoacylase family protein n=1 Tax=Fictibacillus fluitans TaxID=3058422 RepID=A0ABT8HTD6_9BACL|nr:M20 peptidase aminoacylase family protein [Fictibacillus sp. NE201]MDN4524031.1 M20 peptidase aminoacylase family protein [Fictibacillus sp. NE201]